jgi:hypothetical protein
MSVRITTLRYPMSRHGKNGGPQLLGTKIPWF